jgi:hypothetical protein
MTREEALRQVDRLLQHFHWDRNHERIAAWMGRHTPPLTWETVTAQHLQALAANLQKVEKQMREGQHEAGIDPMLDLIWEASAQMHRLGWTRSNPELLRWLEGWGVKSLVELDSDQYRVLIGRLQGMAYPENPTQAVAIAHLQWQMQKLILVACNLFNSEWESISGERQLAMRATGELLSKLKTYSVPTTAEGAVGVSSQ